MFSSPGFSTLEGPAQAGSDASFNLITASQHRNHDDEKPSMDVSSVAPPLETPSARFPTTYSHARDGDVFSDTQKATSKSISVNPQTLRPFNEGSTDVTGFEGGNAVRRRIPKRRTYKYSVFPPREEYTVQGFAFPSPPAHDPRVPRKRAQKIKALSQTTPRAVTTLSISDWMKKGPQTKLSDRSNLRQRYMSPDTPDSPLSPVSAVTGSSIQFLGSPTSTEATSPGILSPFGEYQSPQIDSSRRGLPDSIANDDDTVASYDYIPASSDSGSPIASSQCLPLSTHNLSMAQKHPWPQERDHPNDSLSEQGKGVGRGANKSCVSPSAPISKKEYDCKGSSTELSSRPSTISRSSSDSEGPCGFYPDQMRNLGTPSASSRLKRVQNAMMTFKPTNENRHSRDCKYNDSDKTSAKDSSHLAVTCSCAAHAQMVQNYRAKIKGMEEARKKRLKLKPIQEDDETESDAASGSFFAGSKISMSKLSSLSRRSGSLSKRRIESVASSGLSTFFHSGSSVETNPLGKMTREAEIVIDRSMPAGTQGNGQDKAQDETQRTTQAEMLDGTGEKDERQNLIKMEDNVSAWILSGSQDAVSDEVTDTSLNEITEEVPGDVKERTSNDDSQDDNTVSTYYSVEDDISSNFADDLADVVGSEIPEEISGELPFEVQDDLPDEDQDSSPDGAEANFSGNSDESPGSLPAGSEWLGYLLPSRPHSILARINIDWNDVMAHAAAELENEL